jgi:hypothetical protein
MKRFAFQEAFVQNVHLVMIMYQVSSTTVNKNPLPFKGRYRPVLREVEGVGMGF